MRNERRDKSKARRDKTKARRTTSLPRSTAAGSLSTQARRNEPRKARREKRMSFEFEAIEARSLFAAVPAGFSDVHVAGGLATPTAMEQAADGRIFICEQGGNVRIVKNGKLLKTPFLHVNVNSLGER